jgi:hypothetical protein
MFLKILAWFPQWFYPHTTTDDDCWLRLQLPFSSGSKLRSCSNHDSRCPSSTVWNSESLNPWALFAYRFSVSALPTFDLHVPAARRAMVPTGFTSNRKVSALQLVGEEESNIQYVFNFHFSLWMELWGDTHTYTHRPTAEDKSSPTLLTPHALLGFRCLLSDVLSSVITNSRNVASSHTVMPNSKSTLRPYALSDLHKCRV